VSIRSSAHILWVVYGQSAVENIVIAAILVQEDNVSTLDTDFGICFIRRFGIVGGLRYERSITVTKSHHRPSIDFRMMVTIEVETARHVIQVTGRMGMVQGTVGEESVRDQVNRSCLLIYVVGLYSLVFGSFADRVDNGHQPIQSSGRITTQVPPGRPVVP
jgi:hypothetical protein